MKKVELLAPAGNYESFLGAVHAGADAVYLGGAKFGARAYADNFTEEEVCRAVRYAHIYGRKVYLTLNTLVKTREFYEIYDYLVPFYRAGLDGVIIQDMGVFRAVGRWFPDLGRHVSTQMAITGVLGAQLLKGLGADRIVPARELSLEEIREMKEIADIEIETFIHGAICYCYSGQCLFSSMLGGRSGNRGRCAQPCRLPYKIHGGRKEAYPLSLKDMCTIGMLPELIEAGIDSFKIEGRMKSPEYAAGVTALYRKYIDLYARNPAGEYRVEKQDMEKLRTLYIRSGISEGYYHRHNGRQMITLDSPAYAGRDEVLSAQIRKEYLEGDFRLPVTARAVLKKGRPAMLTLRYDGEIGKAAAVGRQKGASSFAATFLPQTQRFAPLPVGIKEVSVEGELVQEAQKQPLSGETVRKQLVKSGNTVFRMERIDIEMEKDVFLPVRALNDLRRMACEKLEEGIIDGYGAARQCHIDAYAEEDVALAKDTRRDCADSPRISVQEEAGNPCISVQAEAGCPCIFVQGEADNSCTSLQRETGSSCISVQGEIGSPCISVQGETGSPCISVQGETDSLHVSVLTKEQCMAAARCKVKRLYLPADLLRRGAWLSGLKKECGEGTEFYLALPYIIRKRDRGFLQEMEKLLNGGLFEGVLVRNLEELYWVGRTFGPKWEKRVVSDVGLYIWNPEAAAFFGEYGSQHYLPYELNSHEIQELAEKSQVMEWAMAVYGRVPLMVAANCIVQTGTGCQPYQEGKRPAFCRLTDRYRKDFPVYTDCVHCYNIIYNSVPLSLHQNIGEMENMGIHTFRLDFTDETGNDVDRVIRYFMDLLEGRGGGPPYKEYTKGHWKRGVG